jgi:branched-chain amino acid aminotransferase
VLTSSGDFCFTGITRANILRLCHSNHIPFHAGPFSLDEARQADEAFVTGTLGGVTPVRSIDGHPMTVPGAVTTHLRSLYAALLDSDAASAPRR